MAITPEEMREIALQVLGPTMMSENMSPEVRAATERDLAWLDELDKKGRREATEDQKKIWQQWGDSELRRIEKEGEGPT